MDHVGVSHVSNVQTDPDRQMRRQGVTPDVLILATSLRGLGDIP
jgi:hypothetical protein